MATAEQWARIAAENRSLKQIQLSREARSRARREAEALKRAQLQAEIDAIDWPARVMPPQVLARVRKRIRERIGARTPAHPGGQ